MLCTDADTFHIPSRIAEKGGGDYEEITEVVEDLDILSFLRPSDLVGHTSFLRYGLPLFS